MKAFGLVLLLVTSAVCAPQNGEGEAVNDAKEPQGEARQLIPADPAALPVSPVGSAAPFAVPQFGARAPVPTPAYFGGAFPGAYPTPYAVPNQGFYPGAPQGYYPGAPFYPGAQPVAPVRKTVKPSTYKVPRPVFPVADAPFPAPVAPAPIGVPGPVVPAPVRKTPVAPTQYSTEPFHVIVKQVQDNNFDGTFTSSYETDHGIVVESSGYMKNAGTPDEVQVMQGSYTYYTPEGIAITTTYIADENGFQVLGDHLPVPQALPQPIAKAIEYQRSLPPSPEDLQEAVKKP